MNKIILTSRWVEGCVIKHLDFYQDLHQKILIYFYLSNISWKNVLKLLFLMVIFFRKLWYELNITESQLFI